MNRSSGRRNTRSFTTVDEYEIELAVNGASQLVSSVLYLIGDGSEEHRARLNFDPIFRFKRGCNFAEDDEDEYSLTGLFIMSFLILLLQICISSNETFCNIFEVFFGGDVVNKFGNVRLRLIFDLSSLSFCSICTKMQA